MNSQCLPFQHELMMDYVGLMSDCFSKIALLMA